MTQNTSKIAHFRTECLHNRRPRIQSSKTMTNIQKTLAFKKWHQKENGTKKKKQQEKVTKNKNSKNHKKKKKKIIIKIRKTKYFFLGDFTIFSLLRRSPIPLEF